MIGQPRSTQRRRPVIRDDEDALTAAVIRLATTYGRYGYRRITALLRAEGWQEYSIKIGDTYYSYKRLDPFAMTLGVAADLATFPEGMSQREKDDKAALVVASKHRR